MLIYLKADQILHNETPSDFFARTLDTNPALKGLTVIQDYHTHKLTLPELDPRRDTLAQTFESGSIII